MQHIHISLKSKRIRRLALIAFVLVTTRRKKTMSKTEKHPRKYYEVYKAKDGFRWRLISNGKIVGDSGESYTRRSSVTRALKRTVKATHPIIHTL